MNAVATPDGRVTLGGVRYYQEPLTRLSPPPNGDPCYWCHAYTNERLCDALCPYCRTDHVFIRRTT